MSNNSWINEQAVSTSATSKTRDISGRKGGAVFSSFIAVLQRLKTNSVRPDRVTVHRKSLRRGEWWR